MQVIKFNDHPDNAGKLWKKDQAITCGYKVGFKFKSGMPRHIPTESQIKLHWSELLQRKVCFDQNSINTIDMASTLHQHSINTTLTLHQHCINTAPTQHQHSVDTASTLHQYNINTASTLHHLNIASTLHHLNIASTQHQHSINTALTLH